MKKIYKKTLAIVLSALLIFPLSSCAIITRYPFSESTIGVEEATPNTLPDFSLPENVGRQNWVVDRLTVANQKDDVLYYRGTLYGVNPLYCYTYNSKTGESSEIEIPEKYTKMVSSFKTIDIIGDDVYMSVMSSYTPYLINLTDPDAFEPLLLEDIPLQLNIVGEYAYYITLKDELRAIHLETHQTTTMVAATEEMKTHQFSYDESYIYFQNTSQEKVDRVYRFPWGHPEELEEFVVNDTGEYRYTLKFISQGQLYFDTSDYYNSSIARSDWQGELEYIFKKDYVGEYTPFRDGFIKSNTDFNKGESWLAFYDSDGNYVKDLTEKIKGNQGEDTYYYHFISFGNTAIIYLNGPTSDQRQTYRTITYIDENEKQHDITVHFEDSEDSFL